MLLKKILTILLLLSAAIAHANSKPSPSSAQVNEMQQEESAPENPPAPLPPSPGQEPQSLAPLPSSHEMTDSYEGAFIRMLVTLLGLIFLVFATFWVLRRLGKGKFKMGTGRGRTINVIERRAVSPKTMLYIVEIENKKVLISESQLEVRVLTTYEDVPESTDGE